MTPTSHRSVARGVSALTLLVVLCLAGTATGRAQALTQPAPAAGDLPTLTYRRVFQGSTPEFIEIVVRQDGAAKADVRQLNEAASPQEFVVRPAFRVQLFDLARQLKNFQGTSLEVKRRVANMGQKTFRWQHGAESFETQYNYTADPKAAQLQKMFDNLAQEQADLMTLEQRSRYDRLGINQAIDEFEQHLDRGMLPEPERFLTILDRIAEDSRLIQVARQRARTLAARIRVGQSQ